MNSYQDLLEVIKAFPSGADFAITKKWFKKHHIPVAVDNLIWWGRQFQKEYSNHNCDNIGKSPITNEQLYRKK